MNIVEVGSREPGFRGFIRTAAGVFFRAWVVTADAIDLMPLDRKHRFKKLLVGGTWKPDPEIERLLFGDEMELAKILTDYDWWVLERDINGPVQREILRLGRVSEPDALDQYLCRLFAENAYKRLQQKVSEWFDVPYLAERREMIQECLEAHQENRFHLSVGTLLPLLDGLTRRFRREFFGQRAKATGGQPRSSTLEVLAVAAYYQRIEPSLWGASLYRALERGVYGKFKFGVDRPPSALNRHGILHGEIFGFGNEANSLKVFLLLDTIQHFYKQVRQRVRH